MKLAHITNIYNIIKNPVYCGFRLMPDGEYKAITNMGSSPIITCPEHLQANQIVANKKVASGRQKYNLKENLQKHFLPLSGLLYCGNCQRKMIVQIDKGITYKCHSTLNKIRTEGCVRLRINDRHGYDLLFQLQPLFLTYLHNYFYATRHNNTYQEKIEKLRAKENRIAAAMNKLLDLSSSGLIDSFVFTEKVVAMNAELREIKKTIIAYKAKLENNHEEEIQRYSNLIKTLILNNDRLEEDLYSRMVFETFKKIIVHQNYLEISFKDGKSFKLPREQVDHRGKKIIADCSAKQIAVPYKNSTINKAVITFGTTGRETVLLDTHAYKITYKS